MAKVTHGMSESVEYRAWGLMKNRCLNPNDERYHQYGGRGITVCKEWISSFVAFFAYMGKRPDNHSLDRIDANGNYEPGNCRWATPTEQSRNRTNNKLDAISAGQVKWLASDGGFSQSETAIAFGVTQGHVWHILNGKQWVGV